MKNKSLRTRCIRITCKRTKVGRNKYKNRKTITTDRTQESFSFLNDIEIEIPEEEVPEIVNEQFPILALNFGKLSSFEIQTLIKYKKKIQNIIRPLQRIEHKIQTIEKSYKGFKYLSIFEKSERKTIAQKFGENPTIADLSEENTILLKFWNTRFEFEILKNSTNKLTYLKLCLSKNQTQITSTQTWEFFQKNYSKLSLI